MFEEVEELLGPDNPAGGRSDNPVGRAGDRPGPRAGLEAFDDDEPSGSNRTGLMPPIDRGPVEPAARCEESREGMPGRLATWLVL